jgi:predicted component of type VI protein secretion system
VPSWGNSDKYFYFQKDNIRKLTNSQSLDYREKFTVAQYLQQFPYRLLRRIGPIPLQNNPSLTDMFQSPVKKSPSLTGIFQYPVQNSPSMTAMFQYLVHNSPLLTAMLQYPVNNSPSLTAMFQMLVTTTQ